MFRILFTTVFVFICKSAFAQINENFSNVDIEPFNTTVTTVNVGGMPTGWTEHPYHNNPLHLPFLGYNLDHGWITKEFYLTPSSPLDTVASSLSFYLNGEAANNWMFTKQFLVPEKVNSSDKIHFNWYGLSESQWDPESYEVRISTTNNTDTSAFSTKLFSINGEPGEVWQFHSVDLTPYEGQQVYIAFVHKSVGFFLLIDDIQTVYTSGTDVNLMDITTKRYEKTDTDIAIAGTLKNEGNENVNSLTIEWNDGGTPNEMVLSGLNIAPFQTYTFTHTIPFIKTVADEYNVDVIVKNINTTATDVNPSNNTKPIKISTIKNNPVRKVLIEEATGTWCGYCPRGIVAFEHMDTLVKDHTFIGIAVHTQGNDPMTVPEYENGINNAGHPTCNVDRLPEMHELDIPSNPFLISNYYYDRQFVATPVYVTQNISYDNTTRNVSIEANAEFRTKFSNEDLRFASIIVEDSLTGEEHIWDQANSYSGGQLGPMFGYENLPGSIPGAVHDHVGRVLIGGFHGLDESLPNTVGNGANASHTFNYILPSNINPNNAQVVTLVIYAKTGEVLNATKDPILTMVGVSDLVKEDINFEVYPNPSFGGNVNISFYAPNLDNYGVQIYSLAGKLIAEKELGKIEGQQNLQFEIPSNIEDGAYLLMINNSKSSYAKNIFVSK